MNVPEQLRGGIAETLGLALNKRNRPSKWIKFGFSTSEDALTWTVFTYLNMTGQLRAARESFGLTEANSDTACLLLWGAPNPIDSPDGERLQSKLIGVCKHLGETETSYSEPDVIIDFGESGVVFVEVKYRSGNEIRKFGDHYSKYVCATDAFIRVDAIKSSQLYELTRNWRIGVELASGRPFRLINLVVVEREPKRIADFCVALNPTRGEFHSVEWQSFVEHFVFPEWLTLYLSEKQLL